MASNLDENFLKSFFAFASEVSGGHINSEKRISLNVDEQNGSTNNIYFSLNLNVIQEKENSKLHPSSQKNLPPIVLPDSDASVSAIVPPTQSSCVKKIKKSKKRKLRFEEENNEVTTNDKKEKKSKKKKKKDVEDPESATLSSSDAPGEKMEKYGGKDGKSLKSKKSKASAASSKEKCGGGNSSSNHKLKRPDEEPSLSKITVHHTETETDDNDDVDLKILEKSDECQNTMTITPTLMPLTEAQINLICSKLFILQGKKIILLLKDYKGYLDREKFLRDSLQFSGFDEVSFKFTQTSKSSWRCIIMTEWKTNINFISCGFGITKREARKSAIRNILTTLLKNCFTIIVKYPFCKQMVDLGNILTPKKDVIINVEKNRGLPQIIDLTNKTKEGELRITSLFMKVVTSLLYGLNEKILRNELVLDLEFSPDLSFDQTMYIKLEVLEKYDEKMEAFERYNEYLSKKHLVISAKWNHINLFRKLLGVGGNTNKYEVYYPNTLRNFLGENK